MNETLNLVFTVSSAGVAVWCLKELVFPKASAGKTKNVERPIYAHEHCHRWQPASMRPPVIVAEPLVGLVNPMPVQPEGNDPIMAATVTDHSLDTTFSPSAPAVTIEIQVQASDKPAISAPIQEVLDTPVAPTVAPAPAPVPAPTTEAAKPVHGKYLNVEIQTFWDTFCCNLQEPFRGVIQDILREYDNPNEQMTPSVCRIPNQGKEHDNSLSEEVYKALSHVFLWRHTLDTGEEYIDAVPTKERSGPMYCLGLIACLGHDIAKLKAYLKKYYTTGDHAPLGAQVMMAVIKGRLHAENEKDVLHAIQRHHDKKHTETTRLTSMLMIADVRARERELRNSRTMTLSSDQEPASPQERSELRVPWFDPAEFIRTLQKKINYFKNKSTYAISWTDGHVYFTPNVIFDTFKELAEEKDAPEKLLYESTEDRTNLLKYLTAEMRKHGAIADDLIAAGYHSAKFKVVFDGNEGTIFYTPYRADVFTVNMKQLEREKPPHLKRFQSITADRTKNPEKA